MAIDAAAPPWKDGPYPSAARQHKETPFAELHQCGLFMMSGVPMTAEQHYWPVRSLKTKYKRQVACRDTKGKTYGNGSRRFGAQRPAKPKPGDELRWHCGIDLGGLHGDMVVACQTGWVVHMQTFHLGTWALMIQNKQNGLVFSYNELEKGSWHEFGVAVGDEVKAGQPIGRVGLMGENSSMLHFEAYQTATRKTHSWPQDNSRPSALRDPTKYLLYLAVCGA
ncbi:MAG TPA: M23 family metallopeptidase [Falsiroseomonas sp.]|jgi:murein DD-endopeptidase MepM/ murein hydrolase activator NlpD|nr:M23 family metallopeptidase [Falsiroseomonas sp.]